MKERIFKCITTFSVITAHFLFPLSLFFSILFLSHSFCSYCVSDEIAMLMMVVLSTLHDISPENVSENEMESFVFLCMESSVLHYVNYFRVLYFVVGRFSYVSRCVPGTSRLIQSYRNCIYTLIHQHRHKDLEKHFKVHATQPKCNNPVTLVQRTHTSSFRGIVCHVVSNVKRTKLEHQPESLFFPCLLPSPP